MIGFLFRSALAPAWKIELTNEVRGAVYRKGVRSVVLESSATLRASGYAFTTWTNAFRALDALGVGDKIREHHLLYVR